MTVSGFLGRRGTRLWVCCLVKSARYPVAGVTLYGILEKGDE